MATRYLCTRLVLAVALLASGAKTAAAEYLLGAGDKVQVLVYGAPDLERRTAVNADGAIAMPLIGNVPVAGLTIIQAKQRIEQLLLSKNIVKVPDVSIDITEHRPFYITGDVARPGSYAFQPGMTVRQAVALSAGYDLVRFHFGQNPFLQATELRAEYQTLATELLREQMKLTRQQAELENKQDASFVAPPDIPVAPEVFKNLATIEKNLLRERLATAKSERESLARVLAFSKSQIATLEEQVQNETQNIKQQEEETGRLRGLSERGIIPTARLLDEQRSVNLARSRLQDTQTRLAQAQRVAEEAQRALDRFNEQRRMELMREINESMSARERIKNRIESSAEKFAIVGTASSAVMIAGGDGPEVKLFRRDKGKPVTITGNEDTLVEPGDVIQVTLKASKLLGMTVQR